MPISRILSSWTQKENVYSTIINLCTRDQTKKKIEKSILAGPKNNFIKKRTLNSKNKNGSVSKNNSPPVHRSLAKIQIILITILERIRKESAKSIFQTVNYFSKYIFQKQLHNKKSKGDRSLSLAECLRFRNARLTQKRFVVKSESSKQHKVKKKKKNAAFLNLQSKASFRFLSHIISTEIFFATSDKTLFKQSWSASQSPASQKQFSLVIV